MLYLIIILASMALISVFNYIFYASIFGFDLIYIIVAVVLTTILEILVNGLFAFAVRRFLPQKWFAVDKKHFSASKKERAFYEKIGIKKWKDKVLELGCFTNFSKSKIADPKSVEYVERYIIEANYGIICHAVIIPASFLVIFLYPLKFWFCFGLPVAIVSIFLNLLPLFILRYNLPKLHTLYKINEKRAKQKD